MCKLMPRHKKIIRLRAFGNKNIQSSQPNFNIFFVRNPDADITPMTHTKVPQDLLHKKRQNEIAKTEKQQLTSKLPRQEALLENTEGKAAADC